MRAVGQPGLERRIEDVVGVERVEPRILHHVDSPVRQRRPHVLGVGVVPGEHGVEAVVEDAAVKEDIFRRADQELPAIDRRGGRHERARRGRGRGRTGTGTGPAPGFVCDAPRMRTALEGVLASPRFVFRFEERPVSARAGAGYTIDDVDRFVANCDDLADADGDTVVGETTIAPTEMTWRFLEGSGKWKGITGGGKVLPLTNAKPILPGTAQGCLRARSERR